MMTRSDVLEDIWKVIGDRIEDPRPGSYVAGLIADPKGIDRVLEKVGEEATEFILAVKNGEKNRIISEAADLQFHLLITLKVSGIELSDIFLELESRRRPSP